MSCTTPTRIDISDGHWRACSDVRVLEDRVYHIDCLPADDLRVLEGISQDKERDEEVPLHQTQQTKVRVQRQTSLTPWDKRTRANQENIRFKVW
jgi:hypothetical protein